MPSDVNRFLGGNPPVQLFRVVLILATHLRTRMDQRLAEIDLTTQQAAVLTFVSGSGQPPTLSETARALGTSHQNARQVVAALERKGLIEVTSDAVDRRVRRLAATERVAEAFADRDVADHREVAQWFSALTEEEQRQGVGMLSRVLEQLVHEGSLRHHTPPMR